MPVPSKFQVMKDDQGGYRWVEKAPDGMVVGSSARSFRSQLACEADLRKASDPMPQWERVRLEGGDVAWRKLTDEAV